MKRIIMTTALIAASTAAVAAQLQVDRSIILTGTKRVYQLDQQRDRVTTLTGTSTTTEYSAVCMSRTNLDAVIVDRVGKKILYYSSTGRIATLSRQASTTHIQGIALDQGGQYVMCDNFARAILRTSGSTHKGALTTVKTLSAPPHAICVDDDTGDYVVAVYRLRPAASALLRIDRRSRSIRTIATGLGQLTGVDHDQTSGNFVVTTRTSPHVRIIARDGRTLLTKSFTGANAVRVDDETGTIWVASATQVQRFSPDLRITKLYPAISGDVLHGIELWGRQKIAANPTEIPTRGNEIEIAGRFTGSVNMPYICALSMGGLRPGFRVGSRTLNVAFDALFFVTMNGGLPVYTSGFSGTTSSAGLFRARFLVPPVGIGTRFVFAAVAVNPAKFNNLDVAAAHVFHVQ